MGTDPGPHPDRLGQGPAGAAQRVRREAAVGRAPGAGAPGAADQCLARRPRARVRGGLRRRRPRRAPVRQPRQRAAGAARARGGQRQAAPGHPLHRQRGRHQRPERRALRHGRLSHPRSAGTGLAGRAHLQAHAAARPAQDHRLRAAQPGADRGARQPARHHVPGRPGRLRRALCEPRAGHRDPGAVRRAAGTGRAETRGHRRLRAHRAFARGGRPRHCLGQRRCRPGYRAGGAPRAAGFHSVGARELFPGVPEIVLPWWDFARKKVRRTRPA
ncbi:Uncharacterised protein [Bordetella pertussis]|nr:Uncharacterised protein [Bordetella pertussis]